LRGENNAVTKEKEKTVVGTRSITFRIYPTRNQENTLVEWLGLHRELYNAALQERRDAWRLRRVSLDFLHQQNELPDLKKVREDLIPLGSNALQETVRRVDRAFKAFFRRLAAHEAKPGYPRFRGKNRFDSFTYPSPYNWKIVEHQGEKGKLSITNLGCIRMRGRPRVALGLGEPRTLTIRRKCGKWYASVTVRYPMEALARPRPPVERAVGFDAGARVLLMTSDGERIENPRYLKASLQRLAEIQRQKEKKRKGSKNRKRLAIKEAKLQEKVANQRRDHHHKLTTEIVSQYTFIAIENLSIREMTQSARGTVESPGKNVKAKACFNRSILDAGIATLYQMLEPKAEEAGVRLVRVDPKGTTERCSVCGEMVPKTLSVRVHRCPSCGLVMDRDHNAARNILFLGLSQAGLPQPEVRPPEKSGKSTESRIGGSPHVG
jgi:putative transposase